MTSVLQKILDPKTVTSSRFPQVVPTEYISQPIEIPDAFLAPLPDPSIIKVERIDFTRTKMREYSNALAVILDNVMSREECAELIEMAERAAGNDPKPNEPAGQAAVSAWKPAMVNAVSGSFHVARSEARLISDQGVGYEFMATDYRNSDRIIWDSPTVVRRLWQRILQAEGMRECLLRLDAENNRDSLGEYKVSRGERWVATDQGLNERMRFLRYGPGQFFRGHCQASGCLSFQC